MSADRPSFATFWQGELSPLEASCIASYVRRGYDIAVYSYSPLEGAPAGASARNAEEIVSKAALSRFIFAGKPNLSHYSDYFRYLLFKKTDRIWVDADMLLVRSFSEPLPATILARERQPSICGAVMRLDRDDQHLDRLIGQTESLMGKELLWGETGPLLLTKEFGKAALLKTAFPAERFYAIDHEDFWKVFLPEYANECEQRAENSWGVHLWNNIVDTMGYWKEFAPPEGSFLHAKLRDDDALGLFKGVYPLRIMKQMVENYRLRKTGEDLGIGRLARQLVPSVGRTLKHYRK